MTNPQQRYGGAETSGLISVGWEWLPCFTPQIGCGQQPPNLPVVTYFQRVTIRNNANLTAFQFVWDSGNIPSPESPFTSSLAVVYIDTATIDNNTFMYPGPQITNSIANGVAIQAITSQTHWSTSGPGISQTSTFFNEIIVSNSNILNNTAVGNGGAIMLQDTSIRLISTTLQGNIANFALVTMTPMLPSPLTPCTFSSEPYYGGGAIFASYYSLVEIFNSSSISYNQVLAPESANDWSSNIGFMSGGIFCCPGYNVTVVLDETSRIGNNSSPLVNDMSCENSAFHAKLPICNLVSTSPGSDICEYGPTRVPIGIIVGAVIVLLILIVASVYFARKKWKKSEYEVVQ